MIAYYQEAGEYGHKFYLPYLKVAKTAHNDAVFEIAEEIFGRDYVEEQIKKISKNVREYCDDHRILAKLRWEIGEKISEYFNNK